MIRRIYQSRQPLPYSLHDSRICSMELNGDTLLLKFENGFMKKGRIIEQVDGNIEITKIDLDFCYVYLMEYTDVLCGNEGHFDGEKTSLAKFIGQADIHMDVMEETYGDNQLKLSGYLSTNDGCQECLIELYYFGDVWYQVCKKDTGMAKMILRAFILCLRKWLGISKIFLWNLTDGCAIALMQEGTVNNLKKMGGLILVYGTMRLIL